MKKRIVKKHISRFIKPLIKDLPKVNYRPDNVVNHKIINGIYHEEGRDRAREVYRPWRTCVKKTIQAIEKFKSKHDGIILRALLIRRKAIYVRLFTPKEV